ncbi:MAG: Hpt domain-containing protein, partial [Myxococcota bacterium]
MATDTETQTVIATFLDETREAFQEIEPTLVELEMQIGTEEEQPLINSIFGLYHSVKGGAGLLEFGEIERVTHAAESVLQKVRDGELPLDELLVDLLCRGLDFVSERLDTIEATMSDRGDEARADELVARFAIFAPELSEDREDPAILLFIDDDIVMVEDDGTGEVIDDPPELRATPLEPRLELSGPANPERVASLMEFVGPAVGQLDSAYGALERVMLGEVDVAII